MSMDARGFTLMEILAASLISAVVAGGTLMAFVTAARISATQASPQVAEANGLGQQVLEAIRNHVAQDDTFFPSHPPGWQDAALPPLSLPLPPGGGTESILSRPHKRCYRIEPALPPNHCDGVPGPTDCYEAQVQVCWDDVSGCPC